MLEEDVVQFVTLHLEGVIYDQQYCAMITEGHGYVQTFSEFSRRILDHFDQKDEDEYY